jgi:hypothetical protein
MKYFISAIVSLCLCSFAAETAVLADSRPTVPYVVLFRSEIPADDDATQFISSDWMAAALTFRGTRRVHYVNISVNGLWVVRNIPVLSTAGNGVVQAQWYAFGGANKLNNSATVSYGFSLMPLPAEVAPQETKSASVRSQRVVMCLGGGPGKPFQGGTMDGGELAPKETKHVNEDFPNQEAGLMECGPVALSNSLQWLNKKHKLGMKDDDISTEHMKAVTGWTKKDGVKGDWVHKKAQATNSKIDTYPDISVDKIGKAMDSGCDIELVADKHVAAVVGIAKLNTGKYSIDVAHDTEQGKAGGTKTETIIYAPGSGGIQGGTFLDGTKVTNFVAECKKNTVL